MHILDFIMYFVTTYILWLILAVISNKQYTEELGGALVGIPVVVIYTILYFIFFVWSIDYNWVDIFHNGIHLNIKW